MSRVAKVLPIPRRCDAKGVQRYGFHGLSYAYLMEELAGLGDPAATKGHVILAHLGHGGALPHSEAVASGANWRLTSALSRRDRIFKCTDSRDAGIEQKRNVKRHNTHHVKQRRNTKRIQIGQP